jgi:hypothetical protein
LASLERQSHAKAAARSTGPPLSFRRQEFACRDRVLASGTRAVYAKGF